MRTVLKAILAMIAILAIIGSVQAGGYTSGWVSYYPTYSSSYGYNWGHYSPMTGYSYVPGQGMYNYGYNVYQPYSWGYWGY